jgi:hypothetical protein
MLNHHCVRESCLDLAIKSTHTFLCVEGCDSQIQLCFKPQGCDCFFSSLLGVIVILLNLVRGECNLPKK